MSSNLTTFVEITKLKDLKQLNKDILSAGKGRIKQAWNGPHRGFYRYAVIITALAALYILVLSHDNIFRWIGARREIRHQEAEIRHYTKENAKLDLRIQRLSNERDTLEEFARETFHFAAPGDDVFLTEE